MKRLSITMSKISLKRALYSIRPALFFCVLYAFFVSLEYMFGFSPWVTRPLFLVLSAALFLLLPLRMAILRRQTERALSGPTQVVDPPFELRAPSGTFVLTDLSTLRGWRKTEDFGLSFRDLSMVDLTFKGSKPWDAARNFGLSAPYIYDIPKPALKGVIKAFRQQAEKVAPNLDVDVETKRVPHLERAVRAIKKGPAFFNIKDREILAFSAEEASLVRSWFVDGEPNTVDVNFGGAEASRFSLLGLIEFHSNVLILSDAKALEAWDSFTSRDGLCELVLVGDASEVALRAGGEQIQNKVWRWSNLSLPEAEKIGLLFSSQDPSATGSLSPHGDEFFLAAQLALDSTAERLLPEGVVYAFRMPDKEKAVVSVGLDSGGKAVSVRLSFNADPSEVFFLPPPSKIEKMLIPLAAALEPHLKKKDLKNE